MNSTTAQQILTGHEAIDYANEHDLSLNKYADPVEDARTGLSVEEANEIAREDARLIWIVTQEGR